MQPARAILLKLTSVTVFVIMASLIKAASVEVPPGEAVFFRSIFAIPVIALWLRTLGEFPTGLRTRRPLSHLLRGLAGTGAMGLGFAGLGLLPLPEATAIGYAAPVLVVLLAAAVLGERLRLFRMSAVLLGLFGVMIIAWPRLTMLQGGTADAAQALGAALVLAGAFCAATAQILVRGMVTKETTASIVFYFSISAACLSLLTLPWGWVEPTPRTLAMLIGAGLLGGGGQILLTSSYRFAEVSVIAPFEYASMLLAILSGYLFFAEVPDSRTLLGAVLVISAGVIIIWRERQLGLVRGRARRNMTPGDR